MVRNIYLDLRLKKEIVALTICEDSGTLPGNIASCAYDHMLLPNGAEIKAASAYLMVQAQRYHVSTDQLFLDFTDLDCV